MFRRLHWNNCGYKSIVWRCISRLERTGQICCSRTVDETTLQNVVVEAINKMLADKNDYLQILQENIAKVIKASTATSESAIDKRLTELQEELIAKANNKESYDSLAEEIFSLRQQKHQSEIEGITRDEQIRRITELQDFIKEHSAAELTEFYEAFTKRILKQITVYYDYFLVEFKSGVSVEIDG